MVPEDTIARNRELGWDVSGNKHWHPVRPSVRSSVTSRSQTRDLHVINAFISIDERLEFGIGTGADGEIDGEQTSGVLHTPARSPVSFFSLPSKLELPTPQRRGGEEAWYEACFGRQLVDTDGLGSAPIYQDEHPGGWMSMTLTFSY